MFTNSCGLDQIYNSVNESLIGEFFIHTEASKLLHASNDPAFCLNDGGSSRAGQ